METVTLPSRLCRHASGAPDLDCYTARAHRLRAHAIHHGLRQVAAALVRFARAAARWLDEQAHRRATRRELATLDARTLADIGITHGDIDAIASGAFGRDGTRHARPASASMGRDNVAWLRRPQPGIRNCGTPRA